MANPFDNESAPFLALVNDQGQHSLWPAFADVPAGWVIVFGEASRQRCLEYIEANWNDLRPRRLVEEMRGFEEIRGAALEASVS